MFENILIIALVYMLAVIGAEKYKRFCIGFCIKFAEWKAKRNFYRDFNRRKNEIKKQNLQDILYRIGFKIAIDYQKINGAPLPDTIRLARMIKREYEQMQDYGMIDNMNRCKYEITL